MPTVAKPKKDASAKENALAIARRSFLWIIVGIGVAITGGVYMMVDDEVNRYFDEQSTKIVSQSFTKLQTHIAQDQYLLDTIAGWYSSVARPSTEALDKFKNIAEHEKSPLSFIYLAGFNVSGGLEKTRMISFEKEQNAGIKFEDILHLKEMIYDSITKSVPVTAVLEDKTNPQIQMVVLIRPIQERIGTRTAIVGFVPLARLFGEVFDLYVNGSLTSVKVVEDWGTGVRPILTLAGPGQNTDIFLSPRAAQMSVQLEDRMWRITFTSELRNKTEMIASLPYLTVGAGLFLTFALAGYFHLLHSRGRQIAWLAQSVQKANDDLSLKIAAEKRLVDALRENEQRYKAIFENAVIGICQVAPSGMWMGANKTVAELLGYESAEVLLREQPDHHGILFVDPEERRSLFARLQTESRREHEIEIKTRQDENLWVNVGGRAVRNARGEVIYYVVTMYDITERRSAENALISAKEQADFANRSKSEFLANMSHELRTPLNAIIGFAEIIKDQLFGPAGQTQYVEYARDIYDSGHLLLSLINDILDMSKIEAGKRSLAESVMGVEETISSVIRLVSVRAKAGKVHLGIHVPHGFPELRGEERAIKQILTNLLTNAIKFTPEGGSVDLSAHLTDKGEIAIAVKDTGIGMSAEEIPVAMAPFGQIESALSRKNQGTGLGLPLTRALVELHGGKLTVDSAPGKGTTVTITFPPERVIPTAATIAAVSTGTVKQTAAPATKPAAAPTTAAATTAAPTTKDPAPAADAPAKTTDPKKPQ